MSITESPSVAVAPLAPWMGGKRLLATRICQMISKTPHSLYAEPFVGMGGVFFRRPERTRTEVINDASREVVNLFRMLQRHYIPFVEMLRWQLASRAEFERLAQQQPDTLTDLERAARFLYMQRIGFGGKVVRQTFGTVYSGPARFDITKLIPLMEDVHDRLAGVVIECLGYAEFLDRYDRPATLFYLDPPYWGNEGDYGAGLFAREDFERLAEQLARLKGSRFILSLNDRKEVRTCFKAFNIKTVDTAYSVGGGRCGKKVREVLITGMV